MAGKTRSPNYPSSSLADAIASVATFFKKAQQGVLHPEEAMKAMGYNTVSGASRSRLSAVRKYGLVDDTKDGVKVSDTALAILTLPDGHPERQAAINRAALEPELFRELAQQFKNADPGLIASYLVRRKFSQAGAQQAVDAFKDTMAMVKDPGEGYTSLDAGHGVETTTVKKTAADSFAFRDEARRAAILWQQTQHLGTGLSAEIRVVGEPGRAVRVEDLRRLRKFLDLGIEALEEEDARYAPPSLSDDASSSRS
jgi:hypothetical protein